MRITKKELRKIIEEAVKEQTSPKRSRRRRRLKEEYMDPNMKLMSDIDDAIQKVLSIGDEFMETPLDESVKKAFNKIKKLLTKADKNVKKLEESGFIRKGHLIRESDSLIEKIIDAYQSGNGIGMTPEGNSRIKPNLKSLLKQVKTDDQFRELSKAFRNMDQEDWYNFKDILQHQTGKFNKGNDRKQKPLSDIDKLSRLGRVRKRR